LCQELRSRIKFLAQNEKCDTCGQILPKDHETMVLAKLNAALKKAEEENISTKEHLRQLQKSLLDAQQNQKADTEILEQQLQQTQELLRKYKQYEARVRQITCQRNYVVALRVELEKASEPYSATIAQQEQNIKQLTLEQEQKTNELAVVLHALKIDAFWEEGFSHVGLPALVMHEVLSRLFFFFFLFHPLLISYHLLFFVKVLPQLETYANKYLSRLLKGKLHVKPEMDEDKLLLKFFEVDWLVRKEKKELTTNCFNHPYRRRRKHLIVLSINYREDSNVVSNYHSPHLHYQSLYLHEQDCALLFL
jgi:hypothetical protein